MKINFYYAHLIKIIAPAGPARHKPPEVISIYWDGILKAKRASLAYPATITDINGISAIGTAVITQPVAVIATATSSNNNCFNAGDGKITVTGSNGVSSYLFSIDNGANYLGSGSFNNLHPAHINTGKR